VLVYGPDEPSRKAGLRLDTEAGAKAARGQRTPIVPGNPALSEIIRRVTQAQHALRMPPPYAGKKPLSESEIATLRAWIEQGARWQAHWSFVAPQRSPLPAVRNASWVRNPIDYFVLARLDREGLTPSTETDRARLLRRVTFDLTGLPPALTELEAFADRSWTSKSCGAAPGLAALWRANGRVDWLLDAARYADTHGYQVDPEKECGRGAIGS
jgi:hypothetical protein